MNAISAEVVETGDRRDTRGRKRVTAERREKLLAAWRMSGKTMAAFARAEGISYPTMAGWASRANKTSTDSAPFTFAQVQVPEMDAFAQSDRMLEVRLADGTMVRGRTTADMIALVRGLRG